MSSMYWAECDCRKQSIVLEVRDGQIIFRNIIMAKSTAFYFLKAERNSMGTHFVYVVTFF